MAKFIVGLVIGLGCMYYIDHRSPTLEAKVKTEVTKRAPMVTQLTKRD